MRGSNEENIAFFLLVIILAAAAAFLLSGCSHVYPRAPLISQILKPREGYNGLTNSRCKEYNWKGDCKDWEIINYDLHEPLIRKQLTDFKFRCWVAGDRFHVCEDVAGLCRYGTVDKCWLCKPNVEIIRTIPIEETAYLINAGTKCFNESEYPND